MIILNNILKNLFYIFLPSIIGFIVGITISPYINYNTLNKPPLSPPGILFPIIWSVIYILMGISYFLFRKKYNCDKRVPTIYYLQLFVNALWSIIFFIWKLRFISIIWILLLDILVILLIFYFFKKNKISAYLNLIYLCWILFASYLTIGIYILN